MPTLPPFEFPTQGEPDLGLPTPPTPPEEPEEPPVNPDDERYETIEEALESGAIDQATYDDLKNIYGEGLRILKPGEEGTSVADATNLEELRKALEEVGDFTQAEIDDIIAAQQPPPEIPGSGGGASDDSSSETDNDQFEAPWGTIYDRIQSDDKASNDAHTIAAQVWADNTGDFSSGGLSDAQGKAIADVIVDTYKIKHEGYIKDGLSDGDAKAMAEHDALQAAEDDGATVDWSKASGDAQLIREANQSDLGWEAPEEEPEFTSPWLESQAYQDLINGEVDLPSILNDFEGLDAATIDQINADIQASIASAAFEGIPNYSLSGLMGLGGPSLGGSGFGGHDAVFGSINVPPPVTDPNFSDIQQGIDSGALNTGSPMPPGYLDPISISPAPAPPPPIYEEINYDEFDFWGGY